MTTLLALLWLATAPETLTNGAVLPPIGGQSLTDKPVQLPEAARGKPALLVFSFSKQAGNDARLWSARFRRDAAANRSALYFNVIVLESVPRLLRGMVGGSIKSGMPAALHDRSIRVYRGEAEWKRRLNVSNDGYAYLVVLDSEARVQAIKHGPFDESAYKEISAALLAHISSSFSFTSALAQAASNSRFTHPASSSFPCARRDSINPNSIRPLRGDRFTPSRNTLSASAGLPASSSAAPSDSRTG
jgi:hypothetical protein